MQYKVIWAALETRNKQMEEEQAKTEAKRVKGLIDTDVRMLGVVFRLIWGGCWLSVRMGRISICI